MELKNYFAQDDQGNALPNAQCYVYQRGTESLVTGLVKASGIVQINPFEAANDGLIQFAAPNGLYDLRVVHGARDYRIHVQFNDLDDSINAAERAADEAENAADQAQLSAGIYISTAEAMQKTQVGEYFNVPSMLPGEYLILYRHDAGGETEIKRSSSSQALNAMAEKLRSLDSTTISHQFEARRWVLLKLLMDGSLEFIKGRIGNHSEGLLLSDLDGKEMARFGAAGSQINGLTLKPTSAPGVQITDPNGFILPGGNFSLLKAPDVEKTEVAVAVEMELNHQQRTDHMHVLGYGQSLSRGAYSTPVISITQPFNNLMLASGTKVRAGESGYNASAYVPLIESAVGNDGETPVTALCNGIVRRAVSQGENASDWVMIGSSPGIGGQSVEALGPGGLGFYEKMIQLVKDHAALSASLGKSYSVWAYTWDQGEGNYSKTGSGATATKSAYQYAQLQLELFDKFSREVAKIVGQKFRPYIFTYQVGAHRKYASDTMQIALAQWRVSRLRPDVSLAVPVYILPTYTDNLHLTNEASWLLGEYRSRAMYETMIRRNGKWRPLEPVAVDWTSEYIDIKFHVPSGRLVLDTLLAAATPNFGFDIREDNAVALDLINEVSVIGADTVRLVLSRSTASNALLSYARGRDGDPKASGPVLGPRGNLRDSHGVYDQVVSPLGNTFALHNPCVMFEYDRQYGF